MTHSLFLSEMEGGRRITRRNPTGHVPGATGHATRAESRTSRGRGRGQSRGGGRGRGRGRSTTPMASSTRVGSVHPSRATEPDDFTYAPSTEQEETPYNGEDFEEEDEDDDPHYDRMSEVLEWYLENKAKREQRRQARQARQTMGQGSRGASSAPSGAFGGDTMVRISKYLKEARALGCKSFDGKGDISEAADWIKKLNDASRDMQISLDVKLRVATRLLEGVAVVWWEGVEGKFHGEATWEEFEVEFYNQYYSTFEVNLKRREYTNLKQEDGCSVRQLEQRFRDL
ncbi:unnamed protein product, partial [Cuscuta europaea]